MGWSHAVAFVAALALQAAKPPEESTEVSGLEVKAAPKPKVITTPEYEATKSVGWRAPHYSVEQIASFGCMVDAMKATGRRGAMAETNGKQRVTLAMDATRRYEAVAAEFRAGKATAEQLRDAEQARAKAVSPLGGMLFGKDLQPAKEGPFEISGVSSRFAEEKDRLVMIIWGEMKNTGAKPARSPTFVASALDRFDVVLAEETFAMGPRKESVLLQPGETKAFQVVFPDAPAYTWRMDVHFGVANTERNMRCKAMENLRSVEKNNPFVIAQDPGKAAPVGDKFSLAGVKAATVKQDGGAILSISGTVRNGSPDRRSMPPLTVILKDAKGEAIGVATVDLSGAELDGGATAPIELQIPDIKWKETPAGKASFSDMKGLSVVFG